MSTEEGQVITDDGWHLAASWSRAQEPAFGVTVVLCGEFGFTRGDYAGYASFLRQHGMDVLCFDYRGCGDSAPPAGGSQPHLLDWGLRDLADAIAWAMEKWPDNRIVLVAHGLGGLLAGLVPPSRRIYGMLCIAPAAGFFGGLGFLQRRWLWFRARFVWPLARLFGRRPALPAMMRRNLPDSLALDWLRWCFHPQAPVDAYGVSPQQGFMAWRKPIRCYSFVSNPDEPRRSIHEIALRYPNAPVELVRGAAGDLPADVSGYACFFKPDMAPRMWEETVQWIQRIAPAPAGLDLIEV